MVPILTGGVDLSAVLGVFPKLGKATISVVMSVRPHGTRLPLDGFSDVLYEGWDFNSGNYLFTTDTK